LVTRLADREAFTRGLGALFALSTLPAIRGVVEARSTPVKVALPGLQVEARGVDLQVRSVLGRPREQPLPVAALWVVQGEMAYLAIGSGAARVLAQLLSPQEPATLPWQAAAPNTVSALLLVNGPAPAGSATQGGWLTVALRTNETPVLLQLQGSGSALRDLLPWLADSLISSTGASIP
jgi:hypothetical protein